MSGESYLENPSLHTGLKSVKKTETYENNLPKSTPRSLNPIQAANSEPLNRLETTAFSATLWMLTRLEFALNDLHVSLASVHVLL